MKDFFSYPTPEMGLSFAAQLAPIILSIVLILIIKLYQKEIREYKYEPLIAKTLGSILLFCTIAFYTWKLTQRPFDITKDIPLNGTCEIMTLLLPIALFTKNKNMMKYLLVIPIIGGVLSLLVPTVTVGFTHFRYYQFMIAHVLILIIPFYMSMIYEVELSISNMVQSFYMHVVFLLFWGFVNYMTGWDYAIMNPEHTIQGTPLSFIANLTDNSYLGYIVLSAPLLFILYILAYKGHELIIKATTEK